MPDGIKPVPIRGGPAPVNEFRDPPRRTPWPPAARGCLQGAGAGGTGGSAGRAPQPRGRRLGLPRVPPLAPPDRAAGDLTDDERASLADLDERGRTGSGYSAVQGTRPQTIGYALTDS